MQVPASTAISIHALLAESDRSLAASLSRQRNFYPRSPCGERPQARRALERAAQISIHALLAESDYGRINDISRLMKISIHALLAESDLHASVV